MSSPDPTPEKLTMKKMELSEALAHACKLKTVHGQIPSQADMITTNSLEEPSWSWSAGSEVLNDFKLALDEFHKAGTTCPNQAVTT